MVWVLIVKRLSDSLICPLSNRQRLSYYCQHDETIQNTFLKFCQRKIQNLTSVLSGLKHAKFTNCLGICWSVKIWRKRAVNGGLTLKKKKKQQSWKWKWWMESWLKWEDGGKIHAERCHTLQIVKEWHKWLRKYIDRKKRKLTEI